MTTYCKADYEHIATAIGGNVNVDMVMGHANHFEAAAIWYRSNSSSPNRTPPAQLSKRLKRIASAARKLLGHLGINDPAEAADGPTEMTILEFLASAGDGSEDSVNRATGRIGRLVEILEAVEAARDLERRADIAARDVIEIGDLIVPKGHRGEAAVNDWIEAMITVYKKIAGRKPGTSVDAIERTAGGPLIRFLETAGEPLGIAYSAAAWRKRIRVNLKAAPGQK